jgi:acyl-CoA hydrolase
MSRIIHIEDVMTLIKNHKNIVISMAAAEPKLFLSHLHLIKHDVHLMNCLPLEDMYKQADELKHIQFDSLFYSGQMRKLSQKHPNVSYIPSHLHASGINRMHVLPPDIFIGTGVKHPQNEKVSLSLSNVYEMDAFKRSKIKIIELNQMMPYVNGDHLIDYNDIDYIVETNYTPTEINYHSEDERDTIIGKLIAENIEDESTLQFGIGAIPNAVAKALIHKKNLGIHTEMLSDGLIQLIKQGVVTGSKKSLYPNKHVCSFILGTQELYDYVNHNEDILLMNANYVNDPYVIGQNEKQISINTTIEIDLTGQCNSETLNQKHYSGTGGQSDTAIGAQRSNHGKSFIALHSTTYKKENNGNQVMISKIVPKFVNGQSVTLSRNDIDYVVTEYGIQKLKGYTIKERIYKLISIAHPNFREQLLEDAKKMYDI